MRIRKLFQFTILFALALTLLLQAAPKSLTVYLGRVALEGRALIYDGQVYVPIESVAKALDGEYRFDEASGVATVDIQRSTAVRPRSLPQVRRPHLRTLRDSAYSTGDNLKVLATVVNSGNAPAQDIEVTCTFRSAYQGEIIASVAQLEELLPGQRKTIEFWLYEQRIPSARGGRPYAQPMSVPSTFQPRGRNHVLIDGNWERVTYNFNFEFVNPDQEF